MLVYPSLHEAKWKDILASLGALDNVAKSTNSKTIHAGKGKSRGRHYVLCRAPLVIYKTNGGDEPAYLPGVKLSYVDRLNFLQLDPGGHIGHFCIWSHSILNALDIIYGAAGKNIQHPRGPHGQS